MLPSAHLETAIRIEADRMRGLLLSEDDVRSEKTVILNEFDRGENEPIRKMYHAVWSAAFEAHPYHHPTIGWRSDIENMTAGGLRSFYDRFYWPDNAYVSVIGGFEPERVLGAIRDAFGGIPPSPHAIPELTIREPEQKGERQVTVRMKGDVPALMMAYKAPEAQSPQAAPLHLAAMVLSHGRTSRLYRSLVDAGLATAQRVSMTSFRDPGLFTILVMMNASVGKEDVQRVVLDELHRMATEPVTSAEFKRALAGLEAQTRYSRDGSFATAALLNEAIAAGDWKLFTTFLEMASRQTPETIRQAVHDLVNPDRLTVGYFDPVDS
jgi:zinc protease